MDPDKSAELKKSLMEKGMSESDADDVCKGFPFQKDKEDDKGDDKGKVEKSTDGKDEGPADFEKLSKSLEDLKAELSKPAGLSEAEVSDRISKAIEAEVDPIKRHALAVAETSDLLVKAQQQGMDLIRKSVETLTNVVHDLVQGVRNPPELLAKSVAQAGEVQALEAKLADMTKENDELRKSLQSKPRAVTTESALVPHPSEADPKSDAAEWTMAKIYGRVEDIKKSVSSGKLTKAEANVKTDLANNILFATSGGQSAGAIAKRFNLTLEG